MRAADFYTGIVAEAYGPLRGDVVEAGPYLDFVRAEGEPALELGCGDVGPFLELVAAGIDVEGVDSSADMVRRCREKAAAQGLTATVHHQRMEDLALPRRFRSVYLAGATFNLLPDDATAAAALLSITRHLLPGGAALVPLWSPPPTPAEQIGRVREAVTEQGRQARFHVVGEEYDADARTRTTHVRYRLDGPDGLQEADRDWVMHWYTDDGFRQLAEGAGLTVEHVEVPADDERVVLLRRAGS
ncbi:class I SAM-dependent methyltransferase [Cellulomonas sp. FA1]|uniref:class I SAM-dependent methyltransferase n=1 Tax=Cellulomonas sp. FA1 TaxID=1346710 RepID=UPI0006250DC1|nr:class I SAM-dependent methyltransferase [Cellulomonas sp. FA1]